MTTRSGEKWLLFHDRRGPFVARRDSVIAKEAKHAGIGAVRFRTLGGAYAVLRRLRRSKRAR